MTVRASTRPTLARESAQLCARKRAESAASLFVTNGAYSWTRSLRHDAAASAPPGCVASWRGSLSRLLAARLHGVEPWRKLDEETVYARYRRVVSKRFRLPSGEVVDYEIKDEDDMVAVLALTETREVVLVRQFRPGPEAVLLELPAGVVDPGAEPAETAAAELLEETGYVGRIEPAGTLLEEGYSNRRKYVFVAHACRREREPEDPQPHRGGRRYACRSAQPSSRRPHGRRRRRLSGARPPRPAVIDVSI